MPASTFFVAERDKPFDLTPHKPPLPSFIPGINIQPVDRYGYRRLIMDPM